MSRPGAAVQGGESVAGAGVDHGLAVQEQGDHVGAAPLAADVERGDVVPGLEVHIGSFLYEQAAHVDVTVVRRDVKRGEATLETTKKIKLKSTPSIMDVLSLCFYSFVFKVGTIKYEVIKRDICLSMTGY